MRKGYSFKFSKYKIKMGESKMKKIILCLMFTLILGACGKKDPILEERMDNGIVKIYDAANQEYYTGYVENTKINKKGIKYTAEKGNVKNGVKDGEYTTYWDNGKISIKETYQNGILNGISSKYNVYGDLLEEATYVNGKIEGSIMKVDFYNQKKIVGTIKNNRYVGSYQEYFLNGKLHKTLTYNEKGEAEGVYILYTPNGDVWERAEYKDGLLHGFREGYYNNGPGKMELDIMGYYYKGKPDGNINRGHYYQKNPIISLNDYKESIKNNFTVNDENFNKDSYKVEYYPSGNIKSYDDGNGYYSLKYRDDFNLLDFMDTIKERRDYVKKAKIGEELDSEYKFIEDINAFILGWLLSENLNEKQKKDLEIVSNEMQAYLVDIYIRKRIIVAN